MVFGSPDLIFKWRQHDIHPKSNRKVGLPEVRESFSTLWVFPGHIDNWLETTALPPLEPSVVT